MLPLHAITSDYHDFTGEELVALRKDLRKHGLRIPIVIWKGQIVDGRHRALICEELKIEPRYDDISDMPENEMTSYVRSLNHHRRANTVPLTNAEKRVRIETALKDNPARSDVAVAKECGVAQETVRKARKHLEDKGVTKKVTPSERASTSGKKGEGQHKKVDAKPRPSGGVKKTSIAKVHPLNSLAWSDAAASQRTKFITDVGVRSIWAAMTEGHKDELYRIAEAEEAEEGEEGSNVVSGHSVGGRQ